MMMMVVVVQGGGERKMVIIMVVVVRMKVLALKMMEMTVGFGVDEDIAGWVVEWSWWSGWREGQGTRNSSSRRRMVALAGTKHSLLSPTWHSDRWSAFLIYNEHHTKIYSHNFFFLSRRILKPANQVQTANAFIHTYLLKEHIRMNRVV